MEQSSDNMSSCNSRNESEPEIMDQSSDSESETAADVAVTASSHLTAKGRKRSRSINGNWVWKYFRIVKAQENSVTRICAECKSKRDNQTLHLHNKQATKFFDAILALTVRVDDGQENRSPFTNTLGFTFNA